MKFCIVLGLIVPWIWEEHEEQVLVFLPPKK